MKNQQIAAIYCRLSKEDLDKSNKGDDSESIQNQKLLLIDYATRNDFLMYKVYVDEDLSGFSDRPGFKQMMKDAADGKFNIVICKHQSRFTRDIELVERYIHGYFAEWGIRFISLTDNVDTNVRGNKKARQINGLINEWYSEDLSENIRTVFKKKMEAGQYLGAFASYGYAKDANNRHSLVVDEDAARVVREIFSLYLKGYGASRIALLLTSRGVPTPTQYKKEMGLNFVNPNGGHYSSKHGAWAYNTIKRIISNEVYIGTLIQGRERKVSYKSKKVVIAPKDEWVVIKNSHEPIIDEETFNKVQKLSGDRRKKYGGSKTASIQASRPHILAGKVTCADCGSVMKRSGLSRDKITYYLRCTLSSMTSRRECTPHCITQRKVEDAIRHNIRNLIENALSGICEKSIANEAINKINSENHIKTRAEKDLAAVSSQMSAIQKNIAMTYADKLNGNLSDEDFFSFRGIFEDEKQILFKRKEALEEEIYLYEMRQSTHEALSVLFEKHKLMSELTHEVINDFVDAVRIGERDAETGNQEITIEWLF